MKSRRVDKIIGEAAQRMSEETRARVPDIEWRQIIGLRNRIVHEYFGVDTAIVWEIIAHAYSDEKSHAFRK